jgi:hypothetical protein
MSTEPLSEREQQCVDHLRRAQELELRLAEYARRSGRCEGALQPQADAVVEGWVRRLGERRGLTDRANAGGQLCAGPGGGSPFGSREHGGVPHSSAPGLHPKSAHRYGGASETRVSEHSWSDVRSQSCPALRSVGELRATPEP